MCNKNLRIYLFYISIFTLSACLGLISCNYFNATKVIGIKNETICQNLPEYEGLIICPNNKLNNFGGITNSFPTVKKDSHTQNIKIRIYDYYSDASNKCYIECINGYCSQKICVGE